MSRAANATPPPQTYFPQRNTTPTMRHCSAPTVTAAHFASRNAYQHQPGRRRTKHLPQSPSANANTSNSSPLKKPVSALPSSEGLGLSFEDLGAANQSDDEHEPPSFSRQDSSASFSSSSTDSFHSANLEPSVDTGRSTPIAESVASSISQAPTQLITPASSQLPSPVQPVLADSSLEQHEAVQGANPAVQRPSWMGKMAQAVVNTGMSIGIPFGQNGGKKLTQIVTQPSAPLNRPVDAVPPMAIPVTSISGPRPTMEDLQRLSPEEQLARKREWAEAENRKVTECARLCSQWPQSGYNMSKYGPNGSAGFYQPQSFANPHHVAGVMQRQAELERYIALNAGMFFSCQREMNRDSFDDETDPSSVGSYQSSQASPTTSLSMSMSTDEALIAAMSERKTAADIKAAMASPLVTLDGLPNVIDTQDPSGPQKALNCMKIAREMPELALGKEDTAMDVDQTDSSDAGSLANSTDMTDSVSINRPARAQSCGAKRPLTIEANEEDKRRKVDEAMVVEEALETGVIMAPAPKPSTVNRMSSSVPDLSKARAQAQAPPAVFGHVVKTSDTHPIIISPFFPAELLPILSQHMVIPPPAGPFSQTPLLLSSNIDVPSLLLAPNAGILPSPVHPSFHDGQRQRESRQVTSGGKMVGNLLLSSCPGKRLRMDGPSRGRGPVCRDLATDLRRIKSEGVGCLVCCLDDAELALLGVPWETYREVAADTGLDVIRLPMPDGFTPVSVALFDSQITLIVTKYSLQGINVLVHCRGGVGRAGLTACAWAIKMGFVAPHPSLSLIESASYRKNPGAAPPAELEHQIVMSVVERVIAMLRSRRGLKAIESFEQVQFLARYVGWMRDEVRRAESMSADGMLQPVRSRGLD